MANMNFSANGIDNVKPYQLIRFFDSLDRRSKKLRMIKTLKYSDDFTAIDLSKFFQKRLNLIHPQLPDKSILTLDTANIRQLELMQYIDNLRLLIALRYLTV
jgi:hypothetical protein